MTDQSQPDRPDGDGLPKVTARVHQSNVYGGTRNGTVIKSTADTFIVKWDTRTVACTYTRDDLMSGAPCPITIIEVAIPPSSNEDLLALDHPEAMSIFAAVPPVRGDRGAIGRVLWLVDYPDLGELFDKFAARNFIGDTGESQSMIDKVLRRADAILSLPSAPVSDKRALEISRLEAEGWKQASVVSGYWIKNKPDHEFVNVRNGDLRKLEEATHDITAAPVSGRDAATLEACAQIAKSGAKECTDGDTDWHKGFRYAAHSTALEIESSIRSLSNHKESGR